MLSLNKQTILALICFTFILENVNASYLRRNLAAKQSTQKNNANQIQSITVDDQAVLDSPKPAPSENFGLFDIKQAAELKKAILNKNVKPEIVQRRETDLSDLLLDSIKMVEPVDLVFVDGTKMRVNLDTNKAGELKKSLLTPNKPAPLENKRAPIGKEPLKEIVPKSSEKVGQKDVKDPKLAITTPPSVQTRTVMDTKKASELKKSLLQNQKQDASKKSSQTQKLENRQVVDKKISNKDTDKRTSNHAPTASNSTSSSTFTNSKSYELDFNSLVEALGDYLKKNNITIYNLYTNQPQEAYATSFYPKTPNGYVNLKPYEADEEKNANGYRNQPEKYKINENSHENDNIRQPNQYRVPQQNYERPPLTDIQQVKPNHKIYHAKDTNRVENENQNSRNIYQPQY